MDDSVFSKFATVGICEVSVEAVVSQWSADCFISQWRDEYTLVGGPDGPKAKLSKQQAKELIVELDLMPEQSPVFNSGKTWRKLPSTTTLSSNKPENNG